MEKSGKTLKVFLDASMIVTAAISSRGGSFRILTEASIRNYRLITSRYAYEEAEAAIQEKYPALLKELYYLSQSFILISNPPEKLVAQMMAIINFKDAPILAGAIYENADILVTLDRKHFIDNQPLHDAIHRPIILIPADFIKEYF